MKIFSKDEFYKKAIGVNYKYGISDIEKKDKFSDIGFVIWFEENGNKYEFSCNIKREPYWTVDCQMIKRFVEDIKDKYVTHDLHIDLRKEKLNSTFKLYKFLENHYKSIN
ncbi:MAG: hypothetical protein GX638_13130 [Crenarchaeota archaeon]|nr:hypothetical protein [Thermoproteota archaeon]